MLESRLGLPHEDLICQLLLAEGFEVPRQELKERTRWIRNPDDIVAFFRSLGWSVRITRIQSDDIPFIQPGLAVQMKGGDWLIAASDLLQGRLSFLGKGKTEALSPIELEPLLTGLVLDIRPSLSGMGSLWRWLANFLSEFRVPILATLAMSLLVQTLGMLPPVIIGLVMDKAIPEGGFSFLSLIAVALIAANAFQFLVRWLRQRAILFLLTRFEVGILQGFMEHLLALPFPFLANKGKAELLQATYGLVTTKDLIVDRLLGSTLDGAMAILYLLVMVAYFPLGSVVVLFAGVLILLTVVTVQRRQTVVLGREIEAQSVQRGYLAEMLTGIHTIKAAGAENTVLGRWTDRLKSEIGLSYKRQRVVSWSDVGLDGIRQSLLVVILIWGGWNVLGGVLTFGSLLAFSHICNSFLTSVMGLGDSFIAITSAKHQVTKAMEIMEIEVPPPNPAPAENYLFDPVNMEDVWFRYSPASPWILKGFDLQVQKGEKWWLHAPSGFGKSTILRLLAGLYTPERGSVRISGFDPARTKKSLVYLPQFVHLYSGSIRENLRILSGMAPWERIEGAAVASGLQELAKSLPMGFETVIHQGGGALSGGQRQLIALTAVMASEREILLLDEAMANLDWPRRVAISQNEGFKDKTIVYASHDVSFPNSHDLRLDSQDPVHSGSARG